MRWRTSFLVIIVVGSAAFGLLPRAGSAQEAAAMASPREVLADGQDESADVPVGSASSMISSDGCCDTDSCVAPSCCRNGNGRQSRCQCDACRSLATCSADPYNRLLPQGGFIRVRGWVDGGILGNTANPASNFNGPYNATEVDNGQLNQLYLIMDRVMASDGSFTIGGRADVLYGGDYNLAQSTGLELNRNGSPRWNTNEFSGVALPQLYGEVGTNTSSIKVGHFYTVVGYEGVQSPTNFFYSHAYSYMFAGPFTNWGALANQVLDNWQLQAGVVNGWNSLVETQNHANFLGNLKYTGSEWWSSFAIITGDEFNNPGNLPTVNNAFTNRTRYSFLVSKQFGSRLEYVFHQWLGTQAQGAPGGGTAKWYGIDQYVYYRLADNWRLGTRVEWFRDQDGTRVGLTEQSNPNTVPLAGSYASWTVGVNWTPLSNVLIRPEIRWDSYQGSAKPFDDGQRTSQFLLGLDAIVQF